jgi:hypothetical protein
MYSNVIIPLNKRLIEHFEQHVLSTTMLLNYIGHVLNIFIFILVQS